MPTESARTRLIALIAVGLVGGLLSGTFGVGGGIIMVPLLVWWAGFDQRHAAATSLIAIVPTAIVGSAAYAIQGQVHFLGSLLVAAGAIGGTLIGTRLLKRLSLNWLRWLFIVLLLVVVARTLIEPPTRAGGFEITPWAVVGLIALGVVMGILAGLFGIGGGVIAVPVFIALFGMSDLLAKGTSLLALLPAAVTGSIANTRNRLVRVGDGLLVGIPAVLASFAGVALAFWMDPVIGSYAFAILVLLACVQMIVRAIRAQRKKPEPPAEPAPDEPAP